MNAPFRCKFCGERSWIEPAEQVMPADYCHPSDHGDNLEAVTLMVGIVGDVIREMGGVRDEALLAGIRNTLRGYSEEDHREIIAAMLEAEVIKISVDGIITWVGPE